MYGCHTTTPPAHYHQPTNQPTPPPKTHKQKNDDAPQVARVPQWWGWLGEASFVSHAYSGLLANEFGSISIRLPPAQLSAAAALAAGPAGAGAAAAAAIAAAAAASAGADGDGDGGGVLLPGLLLLPSGMRADRAASVREAVGIMMAFASGSCMLVLLATQAVMMELSDVVRCRAC
jgi:hypothetical protein